MSRSRSVRDKSYFSDQNDITKKMSRTPEGFLLCQDVPIARIGEQIYGPDETAIDAGPDGLVYIMRDADEVFRPETIASFEGKDLVDEHPIEEGAVTPDNWRDLSVGHVQNVRCGDGLDSDFLLADLIVKDADAIAAIMSGKREVSCGYDAEYEQTAPGRGRQHNIIGNHVALVERGRCGPRCSIRDHSHQERHMPLATDDALEQRERLSEEQFSQGNVIYVLSLPHAGDGDYSAEDAGDMMNIMRNGEFVCAVPGGSYRLENDENGSHLFRLADDAERQPLGEAPVTLGFTSGDASMPNALRQYNTKLRDHYAASTKTTRREVLHIDRSARLSAEDQSRVLAATNRANKAFWGDERLAATHDARRGNLTTTPIADEQRRALEKMNERNRQLYGS